MITAIIIIIIIIVIIIVIIFIKNFTEVQTEAIV